MNVPFTFRNEQPLHTQEGDLLEVPAKQRGSPRPATPNVQPLSTSPPTHWWHFMALESQPRPVLPIFPFGPV